MRPCCFCRLRAGFAIRQQSAPLPCQAAAQASSRAAVMRTRCCWMNVRMTSTCAPTWHPLACARPAACGLQPSAHAAVGIVQPEVWHMGEDWCPLVPVYHAAGLVSHCYTGHLASSGMHCRHLLPLKTPPGISSCDALMQQSCVSGEASCA